MPGMDALPVESPATHVRFIAILLVLLLTAFPDRLRSV